MNEDNVITYKQMPVAPPTAFQKICTPALFSSLKMKPINVLLKTAKTDAAWAGYCEHSDFTQSDEIVIDERWVREHMYQPDHRNMPQRRVFCVKSASFFTCCESI